MCIVLVYFSIFFLCIYKVTHLVGNNLLLTQLRHILQLVGSDCSYLLPRHDGGTYRADKISLYVVW